MTLAPADDKQGPLVGLFVTCLVDLLRPSIGFAAIKLLEAGGARVEVPLAQTCCGQPAFNSGQRADAMAIARRVIDMFERYDYVVAPSGSCAGMLKLHYPELLAADPDYGPRAAAMASKCFELTSFIVDVLRVSEVDARFEGTVTYHDSCSSLRELGVASAPRRLLASVEGLELVELADREVCCGFGGTFSVKYPDISSAILEQKLRAIKESGARCVLAGDLGCLMQIAGGLARGGSAIEARHVAEVLAGMADEPAIAAPAAQR
ncbi:(Fe-S)-binding protein [Methyloceanibacter sp.]|uniref:(Fe-S)-binding protein n=1 Tax=Methyloceanibacter sp. TaxID=1965321 RepID=UPI002D6D45DA|nr:(Fe-S)-binding protein [Methyloceanibacter sp.]HZP09027.1 (Fe-S)-binding protein [Methyloceanibacter sp.]